jgi:hypothetical protein
MLGLARVGLDGPLPTQLKEIPVLRRMPDVFETGSQDFARVRPDRPVERSPVVQGKGQHADRSHPRLLAPHHQRQDALRVIAVEDKKRPQPLPSAKVAPVDFQPLGGLKKRSPRRLPKQVVPVLTKAGQAVNLVNLDDPAHNQA